MDIKRLWKSYNKMVEENKHILREDISTAQSQRPAKNPQEWGEIWRQEVESIVNTWQITDN